MTSIDALQHNSLVHFASAPLPDSLCETCKTATERDFSNVKLQYLGISAESGCQECRLRNLGVLRALGEHDLTKKVYVSGGQLTRIWQHYGEGRNERVNGNLSVYFYTEADQVKSSWPIVGIGRAIGARSATYSTIIQKWLRICCQTHTNCRRNGDVKLPTRILEIGSETIEHIKLRECSGSTGSYLALSHCWGGEIAIRTTQNTYHAYKQGINFHCLPKNFQDAVMVARSLGIKYLWIDALCIIQDDKEDWEKESGNMATIYQNAYLVLGADMADSPHGGFLENKEGGYSREEAPVAIVDSENTTIYARWQTYTHWNPCAVFNQVQGEPHSVTEPLLQRAWTLQEQLLASRMVHFSKKEMIWECDSALSCECMELDRGISAKNERVRYHKALTSHSFEKFKIWYEIVDEIGYRKITKPSDILPALSGLAHQFQEHGAGPYLAGIWQNDLPRGLLWSTRVTDHSSRANPYRAPSWSWASIQGKNAEYGDLIHKHDAELKYKYAEVLGVECHTKGGDPCGAVDSGTMKISGPILKMVYTGSYKLKPLHGTIATLELPLLHFDFSFTPNQDEVLSCLLIGELTLGPPDYLGRGLILRKRQDIPGSTFERVGLFEFGPKALQEYAKTLETEEVEII